MHSLHSFLLLAILATCALAAPISKSITKHSFSVPRISNTAFVRDPAQAMARAYSKYGWQLTIQHPNGTASSGQSNGTHSHHNGTHHYSNSSSVTDNGHASSVSASSAASATSSTSSAFGDSGKSGDTTATSVQQGSEFVSPVTIGGQQLNLDFDTGSADLWVFSTELPANVIGSHAAFNPSKSSTFQTLAGLSFELTYGDGSGAAGTVGSDTVSVGGATMTSQAVELATAVSSAFITDTSSDGLMGLGFSSLNAVQPQQQKTFFDNIKSTLEQPVFTADLDENGVGSYDFGVIDTSKYSGALSFSPIDTSNGFWQFNSTSYTIAGETFTSTNPSPAIADTGTSLVLVDPAVAKAYYKKVDQATFSDGIGGYVYPCTSALPAFGVAIGSDYMATIPSAGITYVQVDDSTCFGGVQSNGGSGLQIMGDVLLRQHFVVFDGGNESIGFAAKA